MSNVYCRKCYAPKTYRDVAVANANTSLAKKRNNGSKKSAVGQAAKPALRDARPSATSAGTAQPAQQAPSQTRPPQQGQSDEAQPSQGLLDVIELKARISELHQSAKFLSPDKHASAAAIQSEIETTKQLLYKAQPIEQQIEGLRGAISRCEKRLSDAQSRMAEAQTEVSKETIKLHQLKSDLSQCEIKLASDSANRVKSPFFDDDQAIKSTDLIHQGLGYVMESVKSAVASGTTIDPKSLIDYIANINDVVNNMKSQISRGFSGDVSVRPVSVFRDVTCADQSSLPPGATPSHAASCGGSGQNEWRTVVGRKARPAAVPPSASAMQEATDRSVEDGQPSKWMRLDAGDGDDLSMDPDDSTPVPDGSQACGSAEHDVVPDLPSQVAVFAHHMQMVHSQQLEQLQAEQAAQQQALIAQQQQQLAAAAVPQCRG